MRYVVFGGSGFVGRYTIAALQRAMAESRIKRGEILCVDIADFVPLDDEKCGENLGNFSSNSAQNSQISLNSTPNSNENSQNFAVPSLRGDKVAEAIHNGKGDFNSMDCHDFAGAKSRNDEFSVNLTPNSQENSQISVKFIRLDISKDFNFAFEKDDIVVHLAARAYAPKPPLKPFGVRALREYFASVNVAGTRRIVAQMLRNGCSRLVYFSTDMVYGKPEFLPVSTTHPRRPFGYYGLSKRESEDFIIATRERERESGRRAFSARE